MFVFSSLARIFLWRFLSPKEGLKQLVIAVIIAFTLLVLPSSAPNTKSEPSLTNLLKRPIKCFNYSLLKLLTMHVRALTFADMLKLYKLPNFTKELAPK